MSDQTGNLAVNDPAHSQVRQVEVFVQVGDLYPMWTVKLSVEGGDQMGDPITVDQHTAQRWRRIQFEFAQIQEEIRLAAAREGITA